MMHGHAWGKLKSNLVFISEMGTRDMVSPQWGQMEEDRWRTVKEADRLRLAASLCFESQVNRGPSIGAGGQWFPSSKGCAEWASPTKCHMLVFPGYRTQLLCTARRQC